MPPNIHQALLLGWVSGRQLCLQHQSVIGCPWPAKSEAPQHDPHVPCRLSHGWHAGDITAHVSFLASNLYKPRDTRKFVSATKFSCRFVSAGRTPMFRARRLGEHAAAKKSQAGRRTSERFEDIFDWYTLVGDCTVPVRSCDSFMLAAVK